MSEFHTVGGRYDIREKWIGLDYANAFMQHSEHVEAIVMHEAVHAIIAGTDYGQASHIIFNTSRHFKHVSRKESIKMERLIFFSQDFVQEGIATYMQVSKISKHTGKKRALEWANHYLPSTYKEKFDKLIFLFEMSQRYRDFFTNKAHRIAMDNGFQQNAPKLDLLKSAKALNKYLSSPDNNPNKRLETLTETVKMHPWIVTKDISEIAEQAGIFIHDVASKKEGAEFLTYIASHTDKPRIFKPTDVGDPVPNKTLRDRTMDNLIVTNLNANLAESTELLFNKQDFLHYRETFDFVFVNYHDETWKPRKLIHQVTGEYPDMALVGFIKSGEKYSFYCSKETAEKMFDDELAEACLVVKWGGYSLKNKTFIWSRNALKPDIVWYNSPNDLRNKFEEYVKVNPSAKFKRLHVGATEDHPIQMLYVVEDSIDVLHATSDFGNARIHKAVSAFEKKERLLTNKDLLRFKKHINNFMVLQGMHRNIDWVGTMIAQDELKFRID